MVVLGAAGRIGVPVDDEHGLVEFLRDQRDRVQNLEELRLQAGGIDVEGHVAGHVQDDFVAPAGDADAGPPKLFAQCRFLAIHVVADRRARQRAHAGADGRALEPVAAGNRADDRTDPRRRCPLQRRCARFWALRSTGRWCLRTADQQCCQQQGKSGLQDDFCDSAVR